MLAPMLDSGKTGMFFMRVMPVMSAIENDTRTASYDELKTLIENATAISVGPCSCRRARRLMGEGCGCLLYTSLEHHRLERDVARALADAQQRAVDRARAVEPLSLIHILRYSVFRSQTA